MTRIFLPAILLAVAGIAHAQERSVEQQIAEALMPLPDDLRAGATVMGYDTGGKKVVLREGTSNIMCTADGPEDGFSVRCYPKVLEGYRVRVAQLQAEGLAEGELRDIISAEVTSGKVRVPDRVVTYTIRGAELQNALPLTTVYVPGATSESTGLTTTPSHYRPWLMFAGTPVAHIMIPGK